MYTSCKRNNISMRGIITQISIPTLNISSSRWGSDDRYPLGIYIGFDELKKFLLNNIATEEEGPKITIPVGNFFVRDSANGRIYTRKHMK